MGKLEAQLSRRELIAENITESFRGDEMMKAKEIGDVHKNGKWVWTEYAPGKFDWRVIGGRLNNRSASSNVPPKKESAKVEDKERLGDLIIAVNEKVPWEGKWQTVMNYNPKTGEIVLDTGDMVYEDELELEWSNYQSGKKVLPDYPR